MKKLGQLFFILSSTLGFSQCEITGSSTAIVGEKSTYTINNDIAQCKHCHQWTSTGNGVITSDNRLKSVQINPQSAGNITLATQYLSDNGLIKCSKEVNIIAKENTETTASSAKPAPQGNCDIDTNNFETVKINGERLTLMPNSHQDFKYTWEINYKNGQQVKSTERAPQVNYSKENPIVSTSVMVVSKSCYKKLSKNYDDNFWKFF